MRQTYCIPVLMCLAVCLAGPAGADPGVERQETLRYLLSHDCGSCHGMTLRGGLGPALLPESLRDRPDELLVNTILDGRPGTPMPPWRGELSTDDAQWLVQLLRKGVGP
jgi:cytochrome c55X